MKRYLGVISGVILAIFVFVAIILIAQNHNNIAVFDYQKTVEASERIDFTNYDPDTIIDADNTSGNISEKIEGSEKAPIIIYEYADYACSHCAETNIVVNKLIKEHDGKVAVVFRGYLINYFRNNVIAASAATAAQLQGYWNEYKNLLFENQATWYYQSGSKLRDYLGELFTEASDGNGDLAKFYEDLDSKEVAKRVAFEYGLGAKVDIAGTPTFRINGEPVAVSSIRETVEDLVKKLNN